MEKITEFRNLRRLTHHAYCDDCNIELKFGGMVLSSYPPQYPHYCPKCNKKYTYNNTYPWSEIIGDEVNENGACISL